MLFKLPPAATLYQALLDRDANFDGRAFVCVTSTGIFCRLTCPARKPKPENCRFEASVADCLGAGFRACKRCHPLQAEAVADPVAGTLLAALAERPSYRWQEADLLRMGLDLSTVRRSFRRHFGMTFLEKARQRRIPAGDTRSYAQIAQRLGAPNASRAVARANGANQIARIIPCHRVLGSDGALTGYGGGLWRKQRLLELEYQYATSRKG